jgi:hypothetical protein
MRCTETLTPSNTWFAAVCIATRESCLPAVCRWLILVMLRQTQLCEDIFAARFLSLFSVEEELHEELRDIYRNMQRLYRYTSKPKFA